MSLVTQYVLICLLALTFTSWHDLEMGFFDAFRAREQRVTSSVVIDDTWILEVDDAIESHESSTRVAYGENQHLEVVGESFHRENLLKIAEGGAGDDAGWLSGFLVPEQLNEFDPNAVAVYVIHREKKKVDALKVGYLPKEMAARVQGKILRLFVDKQILIPLLIRLSGGTAEFDNYGVIANARTDAVNFF